MSGPWKDLDCLLSTALNFINYDPGNFFLFISFVSWPVQFFYLCLSISGVFFLCAKEKKFSFLGPVSAFIKYFSGHKRFWQDL